MNNYKKNNKAVYLCNYHIIWCPKYRRKLLVGKIKDRLEQIIKEVAYDKEFEILAQEIMPDHVHLLVSANMKSAPFKLVKALKGRSSNYLRKEYPELLKMPTLWSGSYFVSSAGNVSTNVIKQYIEKQWIK